MKIIFYFCFVAHAADIWKVFSPGPNLKMWQFSVAKDNEQHSFLVSIWQGVFLCACIPYLSGVGYCIVYLIRVRHNLPFDKRNRLHAFFFVNRLIGACQQEIRLYDRRSLEVSKLRKFRANRWHDAADVVTGLVEREIAGRDTRIKSVKFM